MWQFLLYIFYINIDTKISITPNISINKFSPIIILIPKKFFIPLIKQKKKKRKIWYIWQIKLMLQKYLRKLFNYIYIINIYNLYFKNNFKNILHKITYNHYIYKNFFILLRPLQYLVINIKNCIKIKSSLIPIQNLQYYKYNIVKNNIKPCIAVSINQFILILPLHNIIIYPVKKLDICITLKVNHNIIYNKKPHKVNKKHISLELEGDKIILEKLEKSIPKAIKNNCNGCPMSRDKNTKIQKCVSCPYNLDW